MAITVIKSSSGSSGGPSYEVKTNNFTAENGKSYITYGELTVTDPEGIEGGIYTVVVGTGVAVIDGNNHYESRIPVVRLCGEGWYTPVVSINGELAFSDNYATVGPVPDGQGVRQTCSIGYKLDWTIGILYFRTEAGLINLAISSFDVPPNIYHDTTLGYVVGSHYILQNGDKYVCTDATEDAAVWQGVTLDGGDSTSAF